jgi:type IV pilus assembly protein PilA
MADVTTRITLVELMVMMAIAGIIASVAVPTYRLHTVRSQVAEAQARVAKLKDVIRNVHKRTGRFPANNEAAGLSLVNHAVGKYAERVDIEYGAMHITLGNKANELIAGKVLTLRPLVAEDAEAPISWSCGNSAPPKGMNAIGTNRTNVDARFLPFVCRMEYR